MGKALPHRRVPIAMRGRARCCFSAGAGMRRVWQQVSGPGKVWMQQHAIGGRGECGTGKVWMQQHAIGGRGECETGKV
eukprot:215144-Chlamydomonas_euryale.AAC.4